ncbi:MAG: hypothetical protein ACKOOF_03780 [Planctomycetaceae bacterium]
MSEAKRAAAGSDDLLRDFRGSGLLWPLLITVAVHAVVILATSLPWLREAIGGGKGDLTDDQRMEAAVQEATASLREIAKEHGVKPQDLGSRFSAGGKPAPAKPAGAEKPAGSEKPVPSTAEPAAQPAAPAAAPKPDAPAAPPGPAIPEVKDDVDLFK